MKMFKIEEDRWINLDAVILVQEDKKYFILRLTDGNQVHLAVDDPAVKKIKTILKMGWK